MKGRSRAGNQKILIQRLLLTLNIQHHSGSGFITGYQHVLTHRDHDQARKVGILNAERRESEGGGG